MTASIGSALLQVFQLSDIEEHHSLVKAKLFSPQSPFLDQSGDLVSGDSKKVGRALQREFALWNSWLFSWSIR